MEVAVGAMSVAAGSTLAVAVGANCISSIQECGKRVIATPTLAAEAFDVPKYRSADGRPAIHAEVEYSQGQALSSKFAVFNGEALMVGPDPKGPEPVLLIGGQQVLLEGNTVKLVPRPSSEVTLKFSNTSEAAMWKNRMEEAANANNPQAKFVQQYSQVVESERQMKLLQERIQECQETLEKSEKTATDEKKASDEEWQKKATERDEQIKALKKENQDLKDQVDGGVIQPSLDTSFDESFKRAEAQRVEAEGRVQKLEDKLNALTEGKCMPWLLGIRSSSKAPALPVPAASSPASSSLATPKVSAKNVEELAKLALVERAKVESALSDLERRIGSTQGGAAAPEADVSKLVDLAAQHAKVSATATSLKQRVDAIEQVARQAPAEKAPQDYDVRLQEMEMRKKEVEEQAKLLTQRIAVLEKADKEPKASPGPAGVPEEKYNMLYAQFQQLQESYNKQQAVLPAAGVPEEKYNMLQAQFNELQDSYKKQEREVQASQAKLAEALAQLDSKNCELLVAKESGDKFQEVAQRLAEDNQQLKSTLGSAGATEALQTENQTLQKRLAEAEGKAQQLEEKDKASQLQLREAEKKKTLLKKEFEDEYITLRNDVAQEKKAVADERRLRQVAEEDGQALRQQVADLNAAHAAQADQLQALAQESKALKQRLQTAEASATEAGPLQATVAKLQEETKQLQLKLSRQSTASQSSTEEMSKRLEFMVSENTELKKELKSTWSKISEQSKKMDEERDAFWKELQAVQRQGSGNVSASSSPNKETQSPLSTTSQGLGSSRRLQPQQVVGAGVNPLQPQGLGNPAVMSQSGRMPQRDLAPRVVQPMMRSNAPPAPAQVTPTRAAGITPTPVQRFQNPF